MTPSPSNSPENMDSDGLLDALPLPMLVVSEDLGIHFANPAAEQFMSSSQAYLQRHRLNEFVPDDSPLIAAILQAARGGRPITDYGVELGSHRLPTRPVDIQATPFGSDDLILLTIQERTIAVAMDKRRSNNSAARTVSGLAAVLAHEIKNPLAGIKGAAQLLGQGVTPADEPLTTLIIEESDRIRDLVDGMERFGEVKHHVMGPVNIHAVLERVRQIAKTSFADHIEIEEIYDPSLPPVLGHRDELVRLFLNLIKNASDAIGSRVGGKINLTTGFHSGVKLTVPGSKQGAGLPIEVCVIDNGPGISNDLLPSIFEPFVTTKHDGTGLGLALVAKIIGEHGGVVEAQSEPGATQFKMLLPMTSQDITAQEKE